MLPLPGVSATCFVHSHAGIDMRVKTVMDLTFIAGIDIEDDHIFVSTTARPMVGSFMSKNVVFQNEYANVNKLEYASTHANVVFKTSMR